jgi:hypothetical protein
MARKPIEATDEADDVLESSTAELLTGPIDAAWARAVLAFQKRLRVSSGPTCWSPRPSLSQSRWPIPRSHPSSYRSCAHPANLVWRGTAMLPGRSHGSVGP